MISEINKFSLNWLLSIMAPGSLIVFFILCGCGLHYVVVLKLLKEYETFSIFFFLLFAFVTGILTDSISQQIEYRRYTEEKKHPRLKVLERNQHWLEDLDGFYFKYMGIHLYDWDKNEDKPKAGSFNGKKINNYNLSQFEHYAGFILAGESVFSKLETEKSKYLLCRNLTYSFRLCTVLCVLYVVAGVGFSFFRITAENILQDFGFCIVMSILLLIISYYLSSVYKSFRLSYTTLLYRSVRYYYLTMIQKNN